MTPQQQHEHDEAKRIGWQHFCGDIPVSFPQVNAFWTEVKLKMPDLIIVEGSHGHNTTLNGELIRVYSMLDIAHIKNPTEIIGSIGYDKYEDKYSVCSRLISNARYSHWSSGNSRQMSKHMNKMLKVAIKVLLPKQLYEVYNKSTQDITNQIRWVRDKVTDGLRSNVMNNHKMWRDELLHMAEVGYVPKLDEVKKAMEFVVANREEYDARANYDPPKAYVWIKPDGVEYQLFDRGVITNGDPVAISSQNELPEAIREKMFVLMITDQNKFIEDIGMKEADNKFWVIL